MIPLPACSVVTAPAPGRLLTHVEADTQVEAGDVVAVLEASNGQLLLRAHQRGRVGGALQARQEAVAEGEVVLWIAR